MSKSKITFPASKGTWNIVTRRNAETGIEISDEGSEGWTVWVPSMDRRQDRTYNFSTLAEARADATDEVEWMRQIIAEAWTAAH